MTGHQALRCALFGALLSFSAGSFAQQIVTTSDLIQQPGYQASWQNMVKGQARMPGWARKGVGTSTPAQNLMVRKLNRPLLSFLTMNSVKEEPHMVRPVAE